MRENLRLTWIPTFPTPYESIWSIFTKIIIFNEISLGDLFKFVSKNPAGLPTVSNAFTDIEWIDFARLAILLNIDEERLILGTWGGMGMQAVPRNGRDIRICTKCWERGYHTVLFDIGSILNCPLHHRRLTSPCQSCASHTIFTRKTGLDGLQTRTCPKCQLTLPSRLDLIRIANEMSWEAKEMERNCRKFTEWWRQLGITYLDRDVLFSELMLAGRGKKPYELSDASVPWQLHLALSATNKNEFPWTFNVAPRASVHTKIVEEKLHLRDGKNASERGDIRIHDIAASGYRSLRRHIYKKYVSPHSHCCKRILSLSRTQSLVLDREKICIISLAFLVWRMSIEGVIRVRGLASARADNFAINLIGPIGVSDTSVALKLKWSLLSFFGILERLRGVEYSLKFKIRRGGEFRDNFFYWRISTQSKPELNCGEPMDRTYSVIYPDMTEIFRNSVHECNGRKSKRLDVFEKRSDFDIEDIFYRSFQDSDGSIDVMFKIYGGEYVGTKHNYVQIFV